MDPQASPAERDADLQKHLGEHSGCQMIVENAKRLVGAGRRLTDGQQQKRAGAEARLRELEEVIAKADAVYDGAPWTRYYLVADGKVHGTMRCSTCNNGRAATAFTWLTDDSGRTASAMIGEYGSAMCTVCFPNAPLDHRFGELGARNRAAQDEKDAARCEREAKAAAKGAATPKGDDGNPLRLRDGSTPATERGARMALADRLGNVHWYRLCNDHHGRPGGHPQELEWLADAHAAARAVARFEGDSDIQARAEQIYTDADAKAGKRRAAELRKALQASR